jgi:geranylgeranyl diphosphate synthase, type II
MNQQNSFLKTLGEYRDLLWPLIEEKLKKFQDYPNFCAVSPDYEGIKKTHQEIVEEYPKRKGKYVRPTLVMLTAQAMGVAREKIMLTAAAMEISEDWILGHDDIEDDSLERRGKAALHRIYGKELAINAGDSLHILMWKVLRDNEKLIGTEMTLKIMDEFYLMLTRTAMGQTAEIKWLQDNRLDLTEKDILFILEGKTGYYTIAGPMRLGATLAGASEMQLEKLYEFGKNLGYCFQIQDDLLDLTSDFAGLKKQMGNDIYEGKRTIMLTHLLNNADEKDLDFIKKVLAKKREEKNEEEVKEIIDLMKKYGSLEYAKKLAMTFADKCKNIFENDLGFLSVEPYRSQISEAIDFIVSRDH